MSQFGTWAVCTFMFSTSRYGGNQLYSHKPGLASPSVGVTGVAGRGHRDPATRSASASKVVGGASPPGRLVVQRALISFACSPPRQSYCTATLGLKH